MCTQVTEKVSFASSNLNEGHVDVAIQLLEEVKESITEANTHVDTFGCGIDSHAAKIAAHIGILIAQSKSLQELENLATQEGVDIASAYAVDEVCISQEALNLCKKEGL